MTKKIGGSAMKFIHVADIHLGATPEADTIWGKERANEISQTFYKLIQVCEEQAIDLLLICGDLFHRQPLLRELKEVNYMFSKLTHTRVVFIAGNHDYISSRSNLLDFVWNGNVTFFKTSQMDSVFLEDINTEIYGFSYTTRDIYEPRLDQAMCTVEERINILMGHGGDERSLPINIKMLEKAGFDYVALGHIHKHEMFSSKIAYCGSLEPLDKTELGDHGYILGNITKSEDTTQISTEFVPFCSRQYKQIYLNLTRESTCLSLADELKEKIMKTGEEHFYQVILTGRRDPIFHVDKDALYSFGRVIDVVDQSLPDYDFDQLLLDNKDNLIGAYIKKVRDDSENTVITQKALYYGIEALLGTKER